MISPSISDLEWNDYISFSNRNLFLHCSWQSSVIFQNIFFLYSCIDKNIFEGGKYFDKKQYLYFTYIYKWTEYPEISRPWDNVI